MNLNKTSFVLGNAFGAVAVGAFVIACGGSGDSNTTTGGGGSAAMLKASDIIVRSGTALTSLKEGMIRVQEGKVLASNVALITTSNDLESRDLQSALDNEMAVDIPSTVVGVWDIENYLVSYQGCVTFPTGRVQINADGTYEILTGTFGAASDEAQGTFPDGTPIGGGANFQCNANSDRKYKIIGKGAYFTSTGNNSGSTYPVSSPISITEATVNSMTMYGSRGMSRLTRVVQRPISAPPPAAIPKAQLVSMARQ